MIFCHVYYYLLLGTLPSMYFQRRRYREVKIQALSQNRSYTLTGGHVKLFAITANGGML